VPIALARGENIRLYRRFEIQPHPRLNLIVGDNAAGKTSLLEALYVLLRGRSFRAQNLAEMRGDHGPGWSAFLEDGRDGQVENRVGLGWQEGETDLRLNGRADVALAEIVRSIPAQFVDPTAHRLLDEGPSYRRAYVDWGVFHVEPSFLPHWRRFQRALKQRNRALKEGATASLIDSWNDELALNAEALSVLREAHVVETGPGFARFVERLLGLHQADQHWQRGWPMDIDYRTLLVTHREQHRRLGTTVQGPHRAELRITLGERKAKATVSRGQQKLLVLAMVLAQAELLIEKGVSPPILLVDDFGAELSLEYQLRLASALRQYAGQVFVTAFERPKAFEDGEYSLFHVEHGEIRALESPK
jgi:DNA replication and repair protein RecF